MENPYEEVPVVEFSNRHRKSEVRDAIPIQDVLNKTLGDMVVAGHYLFFDGRLEPKSTSSHLTSRLTVGGVTAPARSGISNPKHRSTANRSR